MSAISPRKRLEQYVWMFAGIIKNKGFAFTM